jgi:uncharacterized membrane protein
MAPQLPPKPATPVDRHLTPFPADVGLAAPMLERRQRVVGTRRAYRAIKATHARDRGVIERIADVLTTFAGSTPFLLLHVTWFAVWIPWNAGAMRHLGLRPFDPYPFGFLTMVVSLEAIFLSIFVLMAQSRESAIAELREEVTLQVNLRMEEEVTKTLQLVAGLYARLGHQLGEDQDLREMLRPLDADAIEKDLTAQIEACTQRIRGERHQGRKKGAPAGPAPSCPV